MGALAALGFLAPIGETLGGITSQYKAVQTQQDAQVKLLQDLVSGNPEYQPILDYAQAGGKDVLPLLGGNVGKDIKETFQQQKLRNLMQQAQQNGWSPMETANQAAAAGVFDSPEDYFKIIQDLQTPKVTMGGMQEQLHDFLAHPPPNMPPDQLARLQAIDVNNPSEMIDAGKIMEGYSKPPPEKTPFHFNVPVNDPNIGWPVVWEHVQDALTGKELPGFPKAVGLQIPAAEQQSLTQAYDVLQTIPEAQRNANNLIKRMDDLKKAGVIAPGGERTWLVDQYRRYTADRRAAGENPLDPLSWGYYTKLPTTDPVYSQYATIMGQTQSMIAGPMKIFRSMGLFQTIAPHIDAPENTPEQNLEALRAAKTRFSRDTTYLHNLEQGLGLPAWGATGPNAIPLPSGVSPMTSHPPADGGGGGGGDPVGDALRKRSDLGDKLRKRYSTGPTP